jgi:hypothetical protein
MLAKLCKSIKSPSIQTTEMRMTRPYSAASYTSARLIGNVPDQAGGRSLPPVHVTVAPRPFSAQDENLIFDLPFHRPRVLCHRHNTGRSSSSARLPNHHSTSSATSRLIAYPPFPHRSQSSLDTLITHYVSLCPFAISSRCSPNGASTRIGDFHGRANRFARYPRGCAATTDRTIATGEIVAEAAELSSSAYSEK